MTTASTTPTHTPRTWNSPHSTLQARPSRLASTPRSTSRTPASVGQAMPPFQKEIIRSPGVERVQQHTVRTSSPNYFGMTVDPARENACSTGHHTKNKWSPPSSQVRSTAAASPSVVPLDQNPDFEAFRKQSELHGFNSGRLPSFSMGVPSDPRSHGASPKGGASAKPALPPSPRAQNVAKPIPSEISQVQQRSPKRMLSSPASHITDRPRRNSPAGYDDEDARNAPAQFLPDDRNTRSSLPPTNLHLPPGRSNPRSDTSPATFSGDGSRDAKVADPIIVTPQHVVNLLETKSEDVLLLDLRVYTQYAKSRIADALNLCIPTTLLKRATYSTERLADTFKDVDQKKRFERWRSSRYIVVYDSNASQLKDAAICVNTLKKFQNEGWSGGSYIIRGGFAEFSRNFSSLVNRGDPNSASGNVQSMATEKDNAPLLAPVIGGCPMPVTKSAANPFFGNIRQNMDLIGGVGQMELKHPSNMTKRMVEELPLWLRKAADEQNHGKTVAERFLHIEKGEQKRMQEALSGHVVYGTPGPERAKAVQIAGIEKGAKNRYNNIWPYEHSRVKLAGVHSGDCDYVNANYIQASMSNKRYIATQGPIPATFADFWNVVWQQDVRVIVMLTAEKEGGQVKAHNYWEDKHYGPLVLNYLSEKRASLEPTKIHAHNSRPGAGRRRSTNPVAGAKQHQIDVASPSSDQPYVIVRRFTLANSTEPFARMREITQLQYSNWPDFGAPAHPAHLLGLVEQCDAVVRQSQGSPPSKIAEPENDEASRPILVHCSAGCGRTGTFCTVDSVIDMLKRQRTSRNTRQSTPMEVDSGPHQGSHKQHEGKGKVDAFSLSMSEDSWIDKDDLDLVEKTVAEFRLQRLSMVQSLRQYVLCYESVLEWLAGQTPRSA